MARPVDLQHRAQLTDAVIDYALAHGLSGLSLRPLAAHLGVSVNTVEHHFGRKDALVEVILEGLRSRLSHLVNALADTRYDTPGDLLRASWSVVASDEQRPVFQLFFDAAALGLREPVAHRQLLDHLGRDWVATLAPCSNGRPTPSNRPPPPKPPWLSPPSAACCSTCSPLATVHEPTPHSSYLPRSPITGCRRSGQPPAEEK